MHQLAKKHGGKCLSKIYKNAKTKLEWQCEKGHRWKSIPDTIIHGSWCSECSGVKPLSIKEMNIMALKHKGKCLSRKYTNTSTKLKWECKEGHRWEAKPNTIRNGSWCPLCRNIKIK